MTPATLCLIISNGLLFAALVIACVLDVKTGKIPNRLTFPCMAAGCVLLVLYCVLTHIWKPILYAGLFSLALFLIGMFGVFGLGDIKLLMASAWMTGPLTTIAACGLASGLILIYELIRRPRSGWMAIRTGLRAYQTGTLKAAMEPNGPRVVFAPFYLAAWVILLIIKLAIWKTLWI